MENDITWWQALLILLVLIGFVCGMATLAAETKSSSTTIAPTSIPDPKPQTKTRCDFTGLLASSIIEEESNNGYEFNGRITTFLCGENGLSFSLREE